MVLVGWDVIFFYICFQIKKKKKKKKNTFESLGSKFQIRGGGDLQKRQGLEGIFLEFYYLYIYIYIYLYKERYLFSCARGVPLFLLLFFSFNCMISCHMQQQRSTCLKQGF